ncbi:alpha/beta hydrolase [Kutzneria viridogrisea]|uniref:Pimeloyl-ACP methyl ester carboxylesterase n=1 Tax=Kutzneria viridogrisea TaxID=47990 RepID=A0ABR6BWD7_9PSEU|nr:pimeloyl-ACP methyl ester carboxylesterase [Kutzneria viridogrisea]
MPVQWIVGGVVAAVTGLVAPAPTVTPTVHWAQCTRDDVGSEVECGTITVPIDWAKPNGDTISVAVYRLKAANRSSVKGTIANFADGPGATGDIAFASLRMLSPDYDLIAVDPRGVGGSSPLMCDIKDPKNFKLPPVLPPTTAAGMAGLEADQATFRKACGTKPAAALTHLDADSVARDTDYLRQALHLPKINIYGHSYGTLIGEKYLARFGQHVRASVLEGVMDPAKDRRRFVTTAAAESEAGFTAFDRWCAANTSCALHGQDVAAVLRKAQAKAEAGQIPGTFFGREWSADGVVQAVQLNMDSHRLPTLATQLAQLAEGRNPIPDHGGGPGDLPQSVPYTDPIVCQDFALAVPGPAEAAGDLAAERRAAPITGYNTNSSQYTALCVGWPGTAPGAGTPARSTSSTPALLVSNAIDVATPTDWAHSVAGQLGDKAALVVVDQLGHGGSISVPGCGQDLIRRYLDDLGVPAAGTRCAS